MSTSWSRPFSRRLAVLAVASCVALTGAPVMAHATTLPASVDLTSYAVPVADQGNGTSSCVGWALGYTLLGWYSRHDSYAGQPFAPMYVYSQINGGHDGGAKVVDGLNVLRNQGVDTAADYLPQGTADMFTQPTPAERTSAAKWRISGYTTLFENPSLGAGGGTAGVAAIKARLAAGQPVAITINERPGFDGLTGTNVDHDTTGFTLSDHVVIALGYDATGLLVQNSFGTDWGNQGFGRIGWDVVQHDVTGAYVVSGFLGSDHTAPTITAPTAVITKNGTAGGSGDVPFTVSFAVKDSGGVAATRLYRQFDGGSWNYVRLFGTTATSRGLPLMPGHRYRFAVRAADRAGNWTAMKYGPSFRVLSRTEHDSALTYSKYWTKQGQVGALTGFVRATSHAKASAQLDFTGRSVAWIATRGSKGASARVYVDGKYVGIAYLHASDAQRRVVVFRSKSYKSGRHHLKIVQRSTGGRSAINIDGFVVTT